jgi:hypothetical protein
VHTGWVFTRSVRNNNAHVHILEALKAGVDEVPFAVTGPDFDNGSEFLDKAVIKLAADLEIFLHQVAALQEERPGHHRVEEQSPGPQVRLLLPLRHGRGRRCAEPALAAGQRPAQLPDPTMEPVGFGTGRNGRRIRLYDKPKTPLNRLLAAEVLAPAQQAELVANRDSLNPAGHSRAFLDEAPIRFRVHLT